MGKLRNLKKAIARFYIRKTRGGSDRKQTAFMLMLIPALFFINVLLAFGEFLQKTKESLKEDYQAFIGFISNRKNMRRVAAFCVIATMIFTTLVLPFTIAETEGDTPIVTAFAELPSDVAFQFVDLGAGENAIKFPETLTAILSTQVPDEEEPEDEMEEELEEEEDLENTEIESGAENENPDENGENGEAQEPDDQQETEPTPVPEPTPEVEPTPEPSPEPTPEVIEPSNPDAPENPQNPDNPENPENPTDPEPSENPDEPVTPTENNPEGDPAGNMPEDTPVETPEQPAPEPAQSSEPAEPESPVAMFVEKLLSPLTASAKEQTSEIEVACTGWHINTEKSTQPVFISAQLGATYVYEPEITSDYPIHATPPSITVKIASPILLPAFKESVSVDGVVITLEAEEGVFLEGVSLFARKLTDQEMETVNSLVEPKYDEERIMGKYFFDIKVLDINANEVQPNTTVGRMRLSFTVEQAGMENVVPEILHINEEESVVEHLSTSTKEQTVSAEVTGFSPYGLMLLGAGPNVLANNGYPYGGDNSKGYILKLKLIDGVNVDDVDFQWQRSSDNETFADISENGNDSTYDYSGETSGVWIRCLVNGNESRAVQVISVGNTTNYLDFAGRIWTQPLVGNSWYISNGTMAYCRFGNNFDVTGFYRNNTGEYMLQTTFGGGGWSLYSSVNAQPAPNATIEESKPTDAKIDDLCCSFNEDEKYVVMFQVDLEETQEAFCIYADTNLGNRTTSGKYYDKAALEANKDEYDELKNISMIGAESSSNAPDDAPAFVISPNITNGLCFGIGEFNKVKKFGFYEGTDSIKINGMLHENIQTAISKKDSALTISWLNIPPGGTVGFAFSVGDLKSVLPGKGKPEYVAEVIEGLDANTVYHVTVGNSNFEYVITTDAAGKFELVEVDDNGQSYDFIGKTIHVKDKIKNTEISFDIAERPESVDGQQEIPQREVNTPEQALTLEPIPTDGSSKIIIKEYDENNQQPIPFPQQYRIYTLAAAELSNWTDPVNGRVEFTVDSADEDEFMVNSVVPAVTDRYPKSNESLGIIVEANSILNLSNNDVVVDYTGEEYDFSIKPSEITPEMAREGVQILYTHERNGTYSADESAKPKATDVVSRKRVYYKVKQDGYYTVYGSYTYTILPAAIPDQETDTIIAYPTSEPGQPIADARAAAFVAEKNGWVLGECIEAKDNDHFVYRVSKSNYNDFILRVTVLREDPPEPTPEPPAVTPPRGSDKPIIFGLPDNVMTKPYERNKNFEPVEDEVPVVKKYKVVNKKPKQVAQIIIEPTPTPTPEPTPTPTPTPEPTPEVVEQEVEEEEAKVEPESEPAESKQAICHVCHRCPTFLGICVYVWIVALLTLLALSIASNVTDTDKESENGATEKA